MTLPYASVPGGSAVRLIIETRGPSPQDLARNLPYAMASALNRSTEETLLAGHDVAKRQLIIRKLDFLRNVFRLRRRSSFRDFASAGIGETRFGLRADDFRGRASVFVDHEEGGVRMARGTANGFLYLGTYGNSLRPTIRDLYPRAWYPRALGLADTRAIEGGWKAGKDRTPKRRGSVRGARKDIKAFVLRYANTGRPYAIARRIGRAQMSGGRDRSIEILWRLSQRRAIPARLRFRTTAERVGIQRLEVNVPGMLEWALDKARTKRTVAAEKYSRSVLPPGQTFDARGYR